jgi:hypothetical protein
VEANTLPDPLEPEPDVVSAYTAAQGFREMSVQDLSVALTAGGLVDLVLDVRSHDEFAAGGCGGCGWQWGMDAEGQVAPGGVGGS